MTSEAQLKAKLHHFIDDQPKEFLQKMYDWISSIQSRSKSKLEQGYSDMAADAEREEMAVEWAEGTLNTSEL